MKPAKFAYERPSTVAEAVDALVRHDGEAKLLSGGQSLVPLLSMRLAQPDAIVDLNGVTELDFVRLDDDAIAIGAMTRHRTAETSEIVAAFAPLLPMALHHVGHVTIRNQGTVGGSIAHADPSAELPAVAITMDAGLLLTGPTGTRVVPASEFFEGFLSTAIEPDELLCQIRFPFFPLETGWAVEEFSRRHGDFAVVAVYAGIGLAADGTVDLARVTVGGVGPVPLRMAEGERVLIGGEPDEETIDRAAAAVAAAVDPSADIQGTAEYRRELSAVLTRRALRTAVANATRKEG